MPNIAPLRLLLTLGLTFGLTGCIAGAAETAASPAPATRSTGPVAACPGYSELNTARIPDGRPLLQAFDSVSRIGGPHSRSRSGSFEDRTMDHLLGSPISPPKLSPAALQRSRQLFEQHYPPALRRARTEGTAVLTMLVDANGTVRETRVARSSMYPEMDAAAARVIRGTPFDPAVAGGCSVPYILTLPLTFKLAQ